MTEERFWTIVAGATALLVLWPFLLIPFLDG